MSWFPVCNGFWQRLRRAEGFDGSLSERHTAPQLTGFSRTLPVSLICWQYSTLLETVEVLRAFKYTISLRNRCQSVFVNCDNRNVTSND